ncbi:MAG: Ig-like domain-containing protein [Acidobacteriia bacterium]|nr:Ig-like domain-containing protein [Terriglobia bacterium]
MPRTKRKLELLAALTALGLLAVAAGCTGFFVNPQLTTVTVGPPSAQIQLGTQLQMTATGTYDDGSRKTLTGGVFWSSADTTNVPISTGGLVTGAGITSSPVTITATANAISGTATVTVNPGNVTGIRVDPSSQTITAPGGSTTYDCFASITGMPDLNVSGVVTWKVTDSTGAIAAEITASQGTIPMTVTTTGSAVPGTYTVTATWTPDTITFTATAQLILD